jgi:dynein heavy chain
MERIYYNMPEDKFSDKTEYMANFKKLIFSLAWFHSIIIERRKFKTLGWTVIYDFSDNDLETSESILKIYLDEKSTGPI